MPVTKQDRTPVCIAGMHRSGTSMVAQMLNLCGVYLGKEADLWGATPDNPEGHWEHVELARINDELLNALGGGWDCPPEMPARFDEAEPLRSLAAKARSIQQETFSRGSWGWKDPRNSLTLAFWQSLWPDLKTVICLRNPLEVAVSLRRRGLSSYAFGLNLWKIYNSRLLQSVTADRRIVTHYEAYFTEPEAEIHRLLEFLGLEVSDQILERCRAGIKVQHHRNRFTTQNLFDAGVSPDVVQLYLALCREAGWPPPGAAENGPLLPAEPSGDICTVPLDAAFADLQVSRQDLETLRSKLAEASEQASRAGETLSERDDRLREMQRQLAEVTQQADRAMEGIADREKGMVTLQAALEEQKTAHLREAALQQTIESQSQRIEALVEQAAVSQRAMEGQSQTIAALTEQAAASQRAVESVSQRIETLTEQAAVSQRAVEGQSQRIEALVEQGAVSQQAIEGQSQRIEALAEREAELKRAVEDQNQHIESLTERETELKSSIEGLSKRIDTLAEAETHSRRAIEAQAQTLANQGKGIERLISEIERSLQQAKDKDYLKLVPQVCNAVRKAVPPKATVAIVSKGDPALLQINGRMGWHFPRQADGSYAGHYPADSQEAIRNLEALRRKGAKFFVVPSTALWWLDHYTDFGRHLQAHYKVTAEVSRVCRIFDLRKKKTAR